MHSNLYLPKGCTHQLASSHKTLRFELNTLNLALGGISVLHKTKYPIASGGHSPPDPLLQRSTIAISPPSQKILDPPLNHSIPLHILKHILEKSP